jgi:uncharacterized protein YjbI with pentapeptide repeats
MTRNDTMISLAVNSWLYGGRIVVPDADLTDAVLTDADFTGADLHEAQIHLPNRRSARYPGDLI